MRGRGERGRREAAAQDVASWKRRRKGLGENLSEDWAWVSPPGALVLAPCRRGQKECDADLLVSLSDFGPHV